ncbi:hypothetical protein L682_06575 [Aquipseudomonas alcaligenes OT 69]|nr:hypothetical protein L682_06575 [Pseudomonas alcaligenes OT 69]
MTTAGFYGKLAGRGDFIHRGLPPAFIEAWDQWLAAGMAQSQAELGAAWLDAYLVSPLWRFAIAPNLLGGDAVVGVVMPSIDRVGRYFPLAIAVLLDERNNLGAIVGGADDWFDRAEALLLSTLEPEADFDAFEAGVQGLGSPLVTTRHDARLSEVGALRYAVQGGESRQAVLAQIASDGCSFWWGHGSERVAAELVRFQGLPPTRYFSRFLVGEGAVEQPAGIGQIDFGSL